MNVTKRNDNFLVDATPNDVNCHFSRNFSTNALSAPEENNHACTSSFRFNELEDCHIVNAIHDVKSNAVGLDEIPLKFIKMILPLVLKPLKSLFNYIITRNLPDIPK